MYFVTEAQRIIAKQVLVLTETLSSFDMVANCSGGGVTARPARSAWAWPAPCRSSTLSCAPR